MRFNMADSQQALSFLIEQTSYIESEIYRIQYPEFQWDKLVPIDTSANEWAKSITYFSMDKVGNADWFAGNASDMRMADINKSKFEQGVEMAAIGYRYTLEELGYAMLIPGLNLSAERAEAASFAYQVFMDKLTYLGDSVKGFKGLINQTSGITTNTAIADGSGSSSLWSTKTADQMIRDVQQGLTGVFESSLTVEMADTVLLPFDALNTLSITRIPNTQATALEYLAKNNLYTFTTGAPLTIKGVLGLGTAGGSSKGRMIAYRKDPRVVKLHLPMPHRFLPVYQTGPMTFDIPGIFRVGSVEIRRPGAFYYLDGITDGTTQ